MRYSLKQIILITGLLLVAPLSFATTWTAGSNHKGKVTVPIEGGPVITWYCTGKSCSLTGPWGNELTLDSCQSLVTRVGKISYYRNSAGKEWSGKSAELAECNQSAR